VITIYDETPYGTIIQRSYYNISGKLVTQLGHLKVIRDCCGKIISKCIEFVDDSDNGVSQWYVVKRDKKGNVLEYSVSRVEAGYAVSEPRQFPQIGVFTALRI